jgi:hypothetical protein
VNVKESSHMCDVCATCDTCDACDACDVCDTCDACDVCDTCDASRRSKSGGTAVRSRLRRYVRFLWILSFTGLPPDNSTKPGNRSTRGANAIPTSPTFGCSLSGTDSDSPSVLKNRKHTSPVPSNNPNFSTFRSLFHWHEICVLKYGFPGFS